MNKIQYLERRKKITLHSISFGYRTVKLFTLKELAKAQIGYSVDSKAVSLCGLEKGDWRVSWLVIANEDECGDPVFADLDKDFLPVYTASHGQGKWKPVLIADSFQSFVQALEQVQLLSKERQNPTELEKNPLSKGEATTLLKSIRQSNPKASMDFWRTWLTN